MAHKKVFSAPDAAPVVIYSKNDSDSEFAYPILSRMLNPGFAIEEYDEIDANSMTKPTSVVFKKDSVAVATLTITYTGAAVNIVRS